MDKIRVLIADDAKDIREYFASVLSKEQGIEIVEVVSSGAEAVEASSRLNPDVILMDIQMETSVAGIEATKAILGKSQNIKVVILTIHEDDDLLFQAYCAGVMDYVIKTSPISDIVEAIKNVHENKMMLRPNVAEKIVGELSRMKRQQTSFLFALNIVSRLTNSEFEILRLVYEGMSYRQIAETRFVSLVTIKSQVNSILKKFEQKSMKDVVKILRQMNFEAILKGMALS